MLTPTPEDTNFDDPNCFNFNGIQNTARCWKAIPVVYGEIFTGSIIVSAGIDTDTSQEEHSMFKIPGVDFGSGGQKKVN